MPTICRDFATDDDAQAAVRRLLTAGIPGAEIRVLMGAPEHDRRDEPIGSFGRESVDAAEPVGSFDGSVGSTHDLMGSFTGATADQRRGSFGDLDRDTVTTYSNGVARVDVTPHRNLRKALVEAGLDETTADTDISALHHGRVLVLVQTSTSSLQEVAAALDH